MVVNLFTNPDMVATSGEVVVWENLARSQPGEVVNASSGTDIIDRYSEEVPAHAPGGVTSLKIAKASSGGANWVLGSAFLLGAASGGASGYIEFKPDEDIAASVWVKVENTGTPMEVSLATAYRLNGAAVTYAPHSWTEVPADEWVQISQITPALGEPGDELIGYFRVQIGTKDGSTPATGLAAYVSMLNVGLSPDWFSETFSPDPDLTPQPRPGGGSQLVGQRVAGLAATNGAVVQSEQWAKSRGVSGRIINNTGSPVTVALDDASVLTRLWTYDGAKETLASLASPSVIPGPATLGESKWVDLITSTAQRYDGPLFSGSTPNSADDSGYGWVYEWVGEPDASPSTREYTQVRDVAIMVVEDLDAPAVGITVEGLSSSEASRVAIYRQTPGKERTLVQGLGSVDVDGAGYWVDYLPPLGVPVTYVVEVLEGDPLEDNEATITIPSKTAWLQDALNPLLAVEVACRPGNRDTLFFTAEAFTAFERPTNSDLVQIMGGRVPVGMTSRRQTPVGIPFNMVTTAAEASSLLREVLIEGTHLVLRVPPEISMLDPVTYLSDVQVSEEPSRQTFLGGHVIRWNMTGSQTRGPRIMAWTALWTYDDVAELYAGYSYIDLVDGRRYVDWQASPDEAQLAGFSTTSGGSNA